MDKNTKQKLKRIWCERLVIGLFAFTALGIFVAKILTVYSQIQVLTQPASFLQAEEIVSVLGLTELELTAGAAAYSASLILALGVANLDLVHEEHVLAQALAERALQHQFMLLGILALCLILILLLLLRQRNQISRSLRGQLIIVLPEEYVADLVDLYQQMKSEKRSLWLIRTIMLWTVLELLWVFYVQINVENLWLPKSRGHNKIDD